MTQPLRSRDAAVVRALPDVFGTHGYEASWYNNATFVLPFLGAVITLIAWGVVGAAELLGISTFFFVVTGLMLPLVYLTWQRTPTVVVVSQTGIRALHQGRVLQALDWSEVTAVRRVETMGNVRWYVVGSPDGDHLTLEGEIENLDALLDTARRLAGLPDAQDALP